MSLEGKLHLSAPDFFNLYLMLRFDFHQPFASFVIATSAAAQGYAFLYVTI